MPLIVQSIALDPARLLQQATHDLFPLPAPTDDQPWPTLPAWLVLRQGGLRDDVHRLAAASGVAGWFDPPVCLFAELVRRWGAPGPAAWTEEERVAVLSSEMAPLSRGVFDRAGHHDLWVPAVDRFIGELISEGITPVALHDAFAAQSQRDDFERARDEQLSAIYAAWHARLARDGRRDSRGGLVQLASDIAADPQGFSARLGLRRDIRIVGLADLRGGWRPLLRALADCPALDSVTVYASQPLELADDFAGHTITDTMAPSLAAALSGASASSSTAHDATLNLLEAPDVAREIEQVAVRVRALVAHDAVRPDRIAVVFRSARPGVDRMADALGALGVPVTARRRTALAQTGPAKALRAVLRAAVEGFSRHALVEVAEQPLLGIALDATVLQAAAQMSPISSLGEWLPAIDRLLARCETRDRAPSDWRQNRGLPDTEQVRTTRNAWLTFLPLAKELTTPRTEADWFAWIDAMLQGTTWGIAERLAADAPLDRRVRRVDVSACEQILRLAARWRAALSSSGHESSLPPLLSAAEFTPRMLLLLTADLITPPETGFGVAVGEALSLGWRAFEHVFVVGLAAGEFPRRQPVSSLLADRDRRALIDAGLPLDPASQWRLREQELFRVLCAAPSVALTLSWPAMDGEGREVARSAFVDDVIDVACRQLQLPDELALEAAGVLTRIPTHEVLTPHFPLVARVCADEAIAHAHAAHVVHEARLREQSPYNGVIVDATLRDALAERFGDAYPWSATQLEELATCGWSWMASRVLALDTRSELDGSMEPTVRGSILHDALDRFFAGARERMGGPVFLRDADGAWALPLLRTALDAAWQEQARTAWMGTPALHSVLQNELYTQLATYVQFEIAHNESSYNNRTKASRQIRMGADAGEVSFRDVMLQGDGVSFQLRGMVDRVDVGVDERVENPGQILAAIDYKSSKGSTPANGDKAGWEDGVVLQVPLYALALQAMHPGKTLGKLEYRTLRNPELVHSLELATLSKDKSSVIPVPEAAARLEQALTHAGRRVRQARDGVFPATPAPSCGCSPYCVARDICRIPGGPVETRR